MDILPFSPDTLKKAVEILKNGGVVAHPADTCFGLTGDMRSPKALKKIQDIKKRDPDEPMSIMISVPDQFNIKDYAKFDDFSYRIARTLFPSPVTLLLPKGPKIPKWYFPDTPLIGLRVPMHNLTQDILMAFKGPLITTSANRSDEPITFKHEEVAEVFQNAEHQPDLVIEGHCAEHDKASTVLKIEKDHARVVRQGPITASQLQSILGVPIKNLSKE